MATKGKNVKGSSSYKRKTNNAISKKISDASGIKKTYVSKQVNKTSKLKPAHRFVVALFLLIGIAIGYFGGNLLQKNDQFRLIGGETISIDVNEKLDFADLSKYVVCISFGRNAISSVSIEGLDNLNLDTSEEKVYNVTYISSDVKYNKIKLSQTIIVTKGENSYDA